MNPNANVKTETEKTLKLNNQSGCLRDFWPLDVLGGWHQVRLPQSPIPPRRQAYLCSQDTRLEAATERGKKQLTAQQEETAGNLIAGEETITLFYQKKKQPVT